MTFKFQPGVIEEPGAINTWLVHEVYHSISISEMLLLIGCALEKFSVHNFSGW